MASSPLKSERKALLGRKIGMSQVFLENGTLTPVTVLEVGPCTVLQVKTPDKDGYSSLQIGFVDSTKRPLRPQQGLFSKVRVRPKKVVREIPALEPADIYRVPLFSDVGGTVEYRDMEVGKDLLERKIPRSRLVTRVVLGPPPSALSEGREKGREKAGEKEAEPPSDDPSNETSQEGEGKEDLAGEDTGTGGPTLVIKDVSANVLKEYPLPPGSSVEVSPGATVSDGELLAYVPAPPELEEVAPGVQFGVGLFREIPWVDVSGVTKGRGFQGCIRRHGFNAGDKAHGSKNVREPGSTGMHTHPGRVLKGKKMPGQLGSARRKTRNLKVVRIDQESNRMLVKGAVPGPDGGYVYIQESLKKKRDEKENGNSGEKR